MTSKDLWKQFLVEYYHNITYDEVFLILNEGYKVNTTLEATQNGSPWPRTHTCDAFYKEMNSAEGPKISIV